LQISATPSQLGGVTAIQVSDSQTADLQFSPSRLGENSNLFTAKTKSKTDQKAGS
jgi:hypothetical protein